MKTETTTATLTREGALLIQSPRWHAINSAMAGISNAIELCEAAQLPELTDRLLAIQRDALVERERP